MDRVLTLDHRHHGKGTVLYSWHPSSQYLATVGTLTSLINGTNNMSVASHASLPPVVNPNNLQAQTRCIWIWSLNGAGRSKDGKGTTASTTPPPPPVNLNPSATVPITSASPTPTTTSTTPTTTNTLPSNSSPKPPSLPVPLPPVPGSTSGGAEKLFQIFTPNPAPCIGLEWDSTGTTLAILQAAPAHEVLLWNFATQEIEHVDLNIKEPTFMRWSKTSNQLAIGTGRGELLLYDRTNRTCWYASAKHKKRITCGDWNNENKFAFASDDRQITICSADGKTFGQVKVKSRPTNVKFGGNELERENIVSVSMDRKTILLYNLDDPENALELAFQQRYGHIVSFKWFRDGYVMVGFSLGYLVVISTHLDEIGREQFCSRFHKDSLRDIAYCPIKHKVATAGENQIKIVDMRDWQEIYSEDIADSKSSHHHSNGPLDKLAWSPDGNYVSVSSRNGCLYVYAVDSNVTSNDAATRAAKARELEESQALMNKVLYKPFNWLSLAGCTVIVTAGGVMALANMVGVSVPELWKLAAYTWSV